MTAVLKTDDTPGDTPVQRDHVGTQNELSTCQNLTSTFECNVSWVALQHSGDPDTLQNFYSALSNPCRRGNTSEVEEIVAVMVLDQQLDSEQLIIDTNDAVVYNMHRI